MNSKQLPTTIDFNQLLFPLTNLAVRMIPLLLTLEQCFHKLLPLILKFIHILLGQQMELKVTTLSTPFEVCILFSS